jgi:hypothetical protein
MYMRRWVDHQFHLGWIMRYMLPWVLPDQVWGLPRYVHLGYLRRNADVQLVLLVALAVRYRMVVTQLLHVRHVHHHSSSLPPTRRGVSRLRLVKLVNIGIHHRLLVPGTSSLHIESDGS